MKNKKDFESILVNWEETKQYKDKNDRLNNEMVNDELLQSLLTH